MTDPTALCASFSDECEDGYHDTCAGEFTCRVHDEDVPCECDCHDAAASPGGNT